MRHSGFLLLAILSSTCAASHAQTDDTPPSITSAPVNQNVVKVQPHLPDGATAGTLYILDATNGTCPSAAPADFSQARGSNDKFGNDPLNVKLTSSITATDQLCAIETYTVDGKRGTLVTTVPFPPSKDQAHDTDGTQPDGPIGPGKTYTISLDDATSKGLTAKQNSYVIANGQLNARDFLKKEKAVANTPVTIDSFAASVCKDADFDDIQGTSGTYYAFNTLVLDVDRKSTSSTWQIDYPHARGAAGWFAGLGNWNLDHVHGMRFYGARNIVIIPVVYSPTPIDSITYTPQFTATTATNVSDFQALLSIEFPQSKNGVSPAAAKKTSPTVYTGCTVVPVEKEYRTSSIELDATGAVGQAPTKTTFVSESNHWWDVSFAFPINKASQISYASDGNTVGAASLSRQNLFAVADFFIPKAELRGSLAKHYIPHPFAGVAISGKPLHNLLFGLSFGVSLVEFYAGAQVIRSQNLTGLSAGSSATPAQVSAATTYSYTPSAIRR